MQQFRDGRRRGTHAALLAAPMKQLPRQILQHLRNDRRAALAVGIAILANVIMLVAYVWSRGGQTTDVTVLMIGDAAGVAAWTRCCSSTTGRTTTIRRSPVRVEVSCRIAGSAAQSTEGAPRNRPLVEAHLPGLLLPHPHGRPQALPLLHAPANPRRSRQGITPVWSAAARRRFSPPRLDAALRSPRSESRVHAVRSALPSPAVYGWVPLQSNNFLFTSPIRG